MSTMIDVHQLSKRFGAHVAVDDLTFQVQRGEAVALWGANGAGKTTVLRCLLHLLPYQGRVSVAGYDMARQGKAARAQIGLVPQELTFHDDLTVRETVTFYARLRRVPSGHDFTALLDHLQLVAHLEKPIRNLSGGLKQRLALALALLCDPPLLLLDEPTANLDIQARDEFIQLLHDLREQGKTLLFSSHRLEEVTALADRVLLLESGRLVVDAPPQELARRLGWAVTLHLYLAEPAIAGALQTLSAAGIPVSRNGSGVRALVDPGEKGHVLRLLYGAGIDVDDFVIE